MINILGNNNVYFDKYFIIKRGFNMVGVLVGKSCNVKDTRHFE